jgi:hypothetical protein
MAGGCEPFLYAQARGGLVSGGYGRDGSVWSYLVPDGVASVTAYYPALGPTQGLRHRIAAATAHARVINNVAVWAMPHEAGDIFPTTITWNAAGGEVLRTVYPM